jgi:hypothetical protein
LDVVGRVGAFTIYDFEYYSPGNGEPNQRSVLVRVGTDEVHEIQVQGNMIGGTFYPIKILHAGKQPLIEVKWDDGGNAHFVHEDYFLLAKTGATLLDFMPVVKAADQAIQPEMVTYQPTSKFDLDALIFTIGAYRADSRASGKMACCTGRVEVQFHIANGRVVPGQAKYVPDWRP